MKILPLSDFHDNSIVIVGAEWCGPCKRLKPRLIEYLESSDSTFDVYLGDYDYMS